MAERGAFMRGLRQAPAMGRVRHVHFVGVGGVGMGGIAEVLAFGAIKYDWDNWKKGMDHSRILDATLRHVYKYANGENKDDESGLNHLKHAATNLAFLLHYVEKGLGNDDRAPN